MWQPMRRGRRRPRPKRSARRATFRVAPSVGGAMRRAVAPSSPRRRSLLSWLTLRWVTKMMKESGVPAGKEVYYNSRFSDPGKEAQDTSTPRSVCRRMPAHGLYFCAVSTIHTVWRMVIITSIRTVVAISVKILTRRIYQHTTAHRSALTPATP